MRPTRSIGCLKLTIPSMVTVSSERTSALNIFTQQVKTLPVSPITQRLMPPPSFAKIAKSSWADDSPCITINVPQELALPWVVGSTVVMNRMVQEVWGMMPIDMMTCQLNVMGLRSTQPSSTVTISEMPTEMLTLKDTLELED